MDEAVHHGSGFALKDAMYQVVAAVIAHSLAIHAGINMAFSTILLPQIMVSNTTVSLEMIGTNASNIESLTVSKDEASWIASIVTITTPIGSILSGLLMDKFGRKNTCIVTAVPLVAAWVIMAIVDSDVNLLYVARALAGFGAGLSTVGLVYVSETSHASVRPMLLSLNSAFVSFGILLTTLLGHLLPWRGVAWFSAALAFTSFVILFALPESPVWLNNFKKNNDDDKKNARLQKSLKWLYRKSDTLQAEYANLLQYRHNNVKVATEEVTEEVKGRSGKVNYWKPILLLLGLFFIQQFSGGYVVIFYAILMFQATGAVEIDEWTSLILLGTIRFAMAIVSSFLSRVVGRRKLLIISGAGMAISMIIAGISKTVVVGPSIIQIICILAFVCSSSFGFLVIPWTLIGELLPHKMRGKGSGLMISFAYLLMFATVKMFLYVLDIIGLGMMFLFLGCVAVIGIVYVYFCIPETLGKTFDEIEKHFKS